MQFITTTFSTQNQTVDNKTFQITTVEQITTAVCDKCDFALTGAKADLQKGGWIVSDDLTLCDECSF